MLRTHFSTLAAIAFGVAALASCSEPAADAAPGVEVFNNTAEPLFIRKTAGEVSIAAGRSQRANCSDGACPALTLRSPICTYGYDLAPFYAHDAGMQARIMPVQVEMDFTLYMLPHGARRAARTLPAAEEARLRPNSVACPS